MRKNLARLFTFLLSMSFFSGSLLAVEDLMLVCSGRALDGSRANVEIVRTWHHIEPGVDPDPSYALSAYYIGANSIGNWDEAGSRVIKSVVLSQTQMTSAIKAGHLVIEEEQSNIAYFFSFELNIGSNEAMLRHVNGKTISYTVSLQCTGDLAA